MTTPRLYHYQRAEAELRMARRAADPAAAKLHYELASQHLDRFYSPLAARLARDDER